MKTGAGEGVAERVGPGARRCGRGSRGAGGDGDLGEDGREASLSGCEGRQRGEDEGGPDTVSGIYGRGGERRFVYFARRSAMSHRPCDSKEDTGMACSSRVGRLGPKPGQPMRELAQPVPYTGGVPGDPRLH